MLERIGDHEFDDIETMLAHFITNIMIAADFGLPMSQHGIGCLVHIIFESVCESVPELLNGSITSEHVFLLLGQRTHGPYGLGVAHHQHQ